MSSVNQISAQTATQREEEDDLVQQRTAVAPALGRGNDSHSKQETSLEWGSGGDQVGNVRRGTVEQARACRRPRSRAASPPRRSRRRTARRGCGSTKSGSASVLSSRTSTHPVGVGVCGLNGTCPGAVEALDHARVGGDEGVRRDPHANGRADQVFVDRRAESKPVRPGGRGPRRHPCCRPASTWPVRHGFVEVRQGQRG